MKQSLLIIILVLTVAVCHAQDAHQVDLTGTVKQKLKQGLIVDDFRGAYDDVKYIPKNHILLVGYPDEAKVVDGDEIGFVGYEDGQFKWGAETLRKWRVVRKSEP